MASPIDKTLQTLRMFVNTRERYYKKSKTIFAFAIICCALIATFILVFSLNWMTQSNSYLVYVFSALLILIGTILTVFIRPLYDPMTSAFQIKLHEAVQMIEILEKCESPEKDDFKSFFEEVENIANKFYKNNA